MDRRKARSVHYLLVTGGRDYGVDIDPTTQKRTWNPDCVQNVTDVLTFYKLFYEDDLRLIAGGAAGLDTLAVDVAKKLNIPYKEYPADWKRYGRSAGHKRNAHMVGLLVNWISQGHTGQVLAWPGGAGTKGCVAEAHRNDLLVDIIGEDPHPGFAELRTLYA